MKGPHLELVETSHLETNTNPSLQAWLCLQAHQRDSSLVVLSGGTSTRQLVDALEGLTCESDETHAHEHLSKQQGRQEKDHAHAFSPCEVALPSVRSVFWWSASHGRPRTHGRCQAAYIRSFWRNEQLSVRMAMATSPHNGVHHHAALHQPRLQHCCQCNQGEFRHTSEKIINFQRKHKVELSHTCLNNRLSQTAANVFTRN